MLTYNKIRGCFLGIAIGDALGLPVEGWSYFKIKEKFQRITKYNASESHKTNAGSSSDDTQLSLAVAEGLMDPDHWRLSMEAQVKHHISALKSGTKGWGRSTKESIRKLANGASWETSGQSDGDWTGRGNGVPMKISPVGLLLSEGMYDDYAVDTITDFIAKLSAMTHRTSIAASSAYAQAWGVAYCANVDENRFSDTAFCDIVVKASEIGRKIFPETIGEDDITERFKLLNNHAEYSIERMVEEFGGGSCYCYNSLPFTYMQFIKNPTIECLYDVVSSGGDTDSNGSMVGAFVGALYGDKVFPQELIDGVQDVEKVEDTAMRFAKHLQIL